MHTSDIHLQRFADFQPTQFDAKGLGSGEQADWLVLPVSQTRDSGNLEQSNFETAEESLRRVQRRVDSARSKILYKVNRYTVETPVLGVPMYKFAAAMCGEVFYEQASALHLLKVVGLPPVEGETIADFASRLESALETSDFETHRFGHWGPGWFEILVVRPGSACHREAQRIAAALDSYPVLNEEDFSSRSHEASLSNIEQVIGDIERGLDSDEGDDWDREQLASEVFSWLWEHEQRECESHDDHGAYPSEASVQRALEALGYLTFEAEKNAE